jgi:DNA polymerase III alpha subunit
MYYQNYHKHTSLSHRYNKDSSLVPKDYFNAMKNIDAPQIYSTVEHGWQSNYFHIYNDLEEFNKKNNTNIKFIFGTEAYWVEDRFAKDSANNHIVLLAKNDNGRKKLNRAIYESFKTGYYYKNRMDLDILLNLPSEDVFVTSACVAFWLKYSNNGTTWLRIDDIVLKLNDHFKDFYLEVQANNTDAQKRINAHIMDLSNKYNIPIIGATDSHEITIKQMEDRDYLLKSNHITYEDEVGNYMDFPSFDELVRRFKEQNILSDTEIHTALQNTNKILDFEDIVLDRSLKVPVAKKYRGLTQEERNKVFKSIIVKEWNLQKDDINKDKLAEYKKENTHDFNEIISCNMADYFIDSYLIMQRGQELGGILTDSGRGSAVSMFLNKLLRLTKVDKVNAPVTMYSERFLTAARILESKTPPDIDNNCNKREPFIEAQREIIGENGTFDLLALGTLKYKSAFKMYARANELDVDTQNIISKQIDAYEKAMKYAKEEVEDENDIDISIYDYVDKKYYKLIDGCQDYMGIVDILKSHPCGTLCYDGDAIEDVGVIMVKSESTKKECWVALQESSTIDSFGYLKQDYLIVDTVGLIASIYKEIGITPLTVNELLKAIDGDKKVWDIYANGYTMCINQVEQEKSTQKVMRYKPQNISELCSFIAGIRPSFKSMYNTFEARQHFDYGIKAFDNLLQDEYRDSSFIFYQEDLMKVLGFAGFPMKDTYTIIKAISKKKKYVIEDAKDRFIPNFAQAILNTHETDDMNVANEMAKKVWKIIENSASYGFNCSHSYCMSIDSVTLAYLKAYYPLQFYKVALQRYTDKGDKNKITRIKQEMNKVGIKLLPIKFGQDNRHFSIDYEHNCINQTMASIKNIQKIAPQELYNIQNQTYTNFIDVLKAIKTTKIDKSTLEILIGLNYFSDFGNPNQLLKIVDIYNKYADAKVISKDKLTQQEMIIIHKYCAHETPKQFREIDNISLMNEMVKYIHVTTDPLEYITFELQYLGYCSIQIEDCHYYGVEEIKLNDYGTPYVKLYRIATGESMLFKIDKKWYNQFTTEYNGKLEQGDILDITLQEKPKRRKVDGEWVEIGTELVIIAFCRKRG